MKRTSEQFEQISQKYISDVLSGKIPACKWVKLSCQRQLNDIERQKTDSSFHYKYNIERGAKVCRFIEFLPHIKGPLANKKEKLRLEPWQIFILMTCFGWLDCNGNRRFRIGYSEIPRKNGKSSLSSGVALYMAFADGESGADVFSAATQRDQAKIVWGDAVEMISRSPKLSKSLGIDYNKKSIFQHKSASKFLPLAKESRGNLDGLNVHCAVIDELHGHKTSAIYDVLVTGMGAREQPLIWCITTAGFDRSGICYDRRIYSTKILDGVFKDDTFFCIIYTIDEDDDWTDPDSWVKANPNFGVSINKSIIEGLAKAAMQMTTALNNFLTKHLNVWVNADTAWMDMRALDKCEDEDLEESDFDSENCYLSTDLATRKDICSVCKLYIKDIEGKRHYYPFLKYYIPEDAVYQSSNDRYQLWDAENRFNIHSGSSIDLDLVEADILSISKEKNVVDLCFDPWNAKQMIQRLEKEGLKLFEMRPTVGNFSEPMKELESAILDGRFHMPNDPILKWMFSNVVAHTDNRDNIYPRRERKENKIDGVVAIIMCIARTMQIKVEEKKQYKVVVL